MPIYISEKEIIVDIIANYHYNLKQQNEMSGSF
jgi:hypothetical protein